MDLVADCAAQMGLFPLLSVPAERYGRQSGERRLCKRGHGRRVQCADYGRETDHRGVRSGSSTKRVWTEPNPDGTHRIERAENVKDVAQYIERIDEMIERKRKFFGENEF